MKQMIMVEYAIFGESYCSGPTYIIRWYDTKEEAEKDREETIYHSCGHVIASNVQLADKDAYDAMAHLKEQLKQTEADFENSKKDI